MGNRGNKDDDDDNLFNMRNLSVLDTSQRNLGFGSASASNIYKTQGKQEEILNYPYLCDETTPNNKHQELQFADKIK
jgi:hypothetical protein